MEFSHHSFHYLHLNTPLSGVDIEGKDGKYAVLGFSRPSRRHSLSQHITEIFKNAVFCNFYCTITFKPAVINVCNKMELICVI